MTAVHGEPRPANLGQGWTVDDSTFGARLALVRQRMQWNIKEAARECGIPAASWGTWENGAMPRRYTEMCRLIADRTGADLGWLVMGPTATGRQARGENLYYPSLVIGAAHADERPSRINPFGGGRRDSVRPTSAVPATKRRPTLKRPANHPRPR